MCAKLVRGLCGTRAAPSRWEAFYTETLESFGFIRGRASACCFYHPGRGARCVAHGCDFIFVGHDADLDWVQHQMEVRFLCKIQGRLGGAADLKEAKLLNRVVRWAPEGCRYEADPRRAEQLLRDVLGAAGGARAVTFPGRKKEPGGRSGRDGSATLGGGPVPRTGSPGKLPEFGPPGPGLRSEGVLPPHVVPHRGRLDCLPAAGSIPAPETASGVSFPVAAGVPELDGLRRHRLRWLHVHSPLY
eukprot:9069122-Alexandrium_andersonii.AAC.3